MNVEISKPISNLNILLHRPPQHTNLPIKLLGDIENDLQPMNGRSERRDNDSSLGLSEDFFECRNYCALRRRTSGNRGVRRIRQKRQHAFLTVAPERSEIDWFADNRRLINFVVTRLHDRANRLLDGEMKTINQRM